MNLLYSTTQPMALHCKIHLKVKRLHSIPSANQSAVVREGYDAVYNQVVLCSNRCRVRSDLQVERTLVHELVHMFDYCTAELDLADAAHLACTEVRAANLVHCGRPGEDGGFFVDREACVKRRAARSVAVIKGVSADEALAVVNRVFGKCYADLEPVGRRTYSRECERRALEEFELLLNKGRQRDDRRCPK